MASWGTVSFSRRLCYVGLDFHKDSWIPYKSGFLSNAPQMHKWHSFSGSQASPACPTDNVNEDLYESMVKRYWYSKIEILGEETLPVSLCPPQISHRLSRRRTRTSAMRSRQNTHTGAVHLYSNSSYLSANTLRLNYVTTDRLMFMEINAYLLRQCYKDMNTTRGWNVVFNHVTSGGTYNYRCAVRCQQQLYCF